MNQTLQGIIINTIRYKDNAFVCRIFMEHHGLKTFLIQVSKSTKSSKVNLLQPLMMIEFEAVIKENTQMHKLKDLRLALPLSEIYFNPIKSTMVLFLNEVLSKTIPDDYVNKHLYSFLWEAIKLLDDAIDERNFHIWCLLEISRHYGFYPYVEDENPNYFDLSTAAFVTDRPKHQYYLEGENANSLLALLNKRWHQVQPINMHSSIRKTLLESLVTFLKLHLENLREIKSLEVLHQVFH